MSKKFYLLVEKDQLPMTKEPINLMPDDLVETRRGTMRARWPRDPDTTRRLNAVRRIDAYATGPRYKVNPYLALVLIVLSFGGLIWLVIANL